MARQSVGELALSIVADAKQLESMLSTSEQKIQSWSGRISKLMTGPFAGGMVGGMIGGGMSGLIDKAAGMAVDAAGKANELFEIATGTRIELEAWRSPIQSAEKAMGRLVELGKSSEDFGIGPQFVRSLQIAMGPEADKMDKVLVKLLKIKAETHDIGSNENFIRKIIGEGAALDSAEARIMRAANLVGDKQALALNELYQSGVDGLDKAIGKVEKLGLAHSENIALAQQWKAALKDVEKLEQAAQEKSMLTGGMMGTGMSRLMAGDTSRGIDELDQGIQNWVNQRMGLEKELTKLQTREFFTQARGGVLDMLSYADPSKRGKLEDLLGFVNEREGALTSIGGKASMTTIDAVQSILKQAAQIAGPKPKTDQAAILEKQAAAAKSMQEQIALGDKLAAELDIIQNTFGGSAKTIEQYSAAMGGATAANVEMIGKLHDLKDAQAIVAANKTPMDRAREELEQLDSLKGTLGQGEYGRALRRLQKQLTPEALQGDREAGVAELGSQAWARAFNRSSAVDDRSGDQLEETKKQTGVLDSIDDRLRELNDRKPAQLNVPPGG